MRAKTFIACVALFGVALVMAIPAEAPGLACTHYIVGKLNLDESCTGGITLELWKWGLDEWHFVDSATYRDGDLFSFFCNGPPAGHRLRCDSHGHWITDSFYVTECYGGNHAVGNIYCNDTCASQEE